MCAFPEVLQIVVVRRRATALNLRDDTATRRGHVDEVRPGLRDEPSLGREDNLFANPSWTRSSVAMWSCIALLDAPWTWIVAIALRVEVMCSASRRANPSTTASSAVCSGGMTAFTCRE